MNLVVADPHHGQVEISADRERGVVEVRSPSLPHATVTRREGSVAGDVSPIGTRDGSRTVLTVGGESGRVSPGTGFATRRSYRVGVEIRGVSYGFDPVAKHLTRFTRNGVELAVFERTATCGIGASWSPDAACTLDEAALGYVLVGAYGVGSPGVLKSLIGHGGLPF
ncbi:hypothetical protein ACIPYS_21210 [Kitasatospora sp. NPDC089913]|uniref:hypothetical protein n=1 Tax=Kitasatospora sp. NPDC089913 TaxID=3364080 RepID=UPI0037FA6958